MMAPTKATSGCLFLLYFATVIFPEKARFMEVAATTAAGCLTPTALVAPGLKPRRIRRQQQQQRRQQRKCADAAPDRYMHHNDPLLLTPLVVEASRGGRGPETARGVTTGGGRSLP